MVNLERQDEILALLKRERVVSVAVLAKRLYVSEATIRRDLSHMDNLGLIRRTHGAAMIARDNAHESAFATRESAHLSAKKALCLKALDHIKDNSVIYMDSSSTLIPIVHMLERFQHLTIVTHGIRTALLLSNLDNVDVFIAGGRLENFSNSVLGSSVIDFYEGINADVALMSASGIDGQGLITDDSIEQAKIKKAIIKKSDRVFLLSDASKLGKKRMNTCFTIDDVDLFFTETKPKGELARTIEESSCTIVTLS